MHADYTQWDRVYMFNKAFNKTNIHQCSESSGNEDGKTAKYKTDLSFTAQFKQVISKHLSSSIALLHTKDGVIWYE